MLVVVKAENLEIKFTQGEIITQVFQNVTFQVNKGDFIVISGPSGSGKTTLLNIIGGLNKPTNGQIIVFGKDLTAKNEDFWADFRCQNIGFVFQSYNLVSTLTVAENIVFPMEWLQKEPKYIEERCSYLLKLVGLLHRADHFSSQLSGGEKQRVAFARALANDPPLLLVDEPTGNLDKKTGVKIVQLLKTLKENEKTVLVVTHDERIYPLANQKFLLEDGKLVKLNE
jgi:putative ABC transport system ATP-binding protein